MCMNTFEKNKIKFGGGVQVMRLTCVLLEEAISTGKLPKINIFVLTTLC